MKLSEYVRKHNISYDVTELVIINKGITELDCLDLFTNVRYICFQENEIKVVPSMDKLVNLRKFDFTDNPLERLPNIDKLTNLFKCFYTFLNCGEDYESFNCEDVKGISMYIKKRNRIYKLETLLT